jgi:hypothetical protein
MTTLANGPATLRIAALRTCLEIPPRAAQRLGAANDKNRKSRP